MSAYWVLEQARKRKIPFVALGPRIGKYRRSSLQAWLAESEERPRRDEHGTGGFGSQGEREAEPIDLAFAHSHRPFVDQSVQTTPPETPR
jgi:hypothetical protein